MAQVQTRQMQELPMKDLQGLYNAPGQHWVGDGFPVRTMFAYDGLGREKTSPFLLLDYAGPAEFTPTHRRRGVGEHPHRGFETVTIVYQGELAHRDSTGQGGLIGAGDVQWMTAASGILHEEFHSPAFASNGGTLEMMQLWVDLPRKDKMAAPGYQTLLAADIPSIALPDNAGRLRVIAGDYADSRGPAKTFSPMNVWDLRLNQGRGTSLDLPEGHTAMLIVQRGTLRINGSHQAGIAQMALLGREGRNVDLAAGEEDVTALLLTGQPLNQPVVGHGPFVMTSIEEIRDAIRDFQNGMFGAMPD